VNEYLEEVYNIAELSGGRRYPIDIIPDSWIKHYGISRFGYVVLNKLFYDPENILTPNQYIILEKIQLFYEEEEVEEDKDYVIVTIALQGNETLEDIIL